MSLRTKERLSKATLYATLNALKRFFIWLVGQRGHGPMWEPPHSDCSEIPVRQMFEFAPIDDVLVEGQAFSASGKPNLLRAVETR